MNRPWICEHRWEGVAGMVRFRKLVMKDKSTNAMSHEWFDDEGRLGYSLGKVGFVAVSRGRNTYSKCGSDETKDLANTKTGLPEGTYCNLARLPGPVPVPSQWKESDCSSDSVIVDGTGTIINGSLPGGEVVVIHKDYKTDTERKPAQPAEIPKLPADEPKDFWGWRKTSGQNDTKEHLGCCFAVSVTVYNEPVGLRKIGDLDASSCDENVNAGEGSDREEVGWDRTCPPTAEEAWTKIQWSRRQEQWKKEELPTATYWMQTSVPCRIL
jgi:hypothetical protein